MLVIKIIYICKKVNQYERLQYRKDTETSVQTILNE